MSKSLKILLPVVGALYALFGVVITLAALTVFFGTGLAKYGEILASQLGRSIGDFPYVYSVIGATLMLAFGIIYLIASFSLFTKKSWAYLAVATVVVVAILSDGFSLATGTPINPIEIFWLLVWSGFAYFLFTQKDALKAK
ncbi:MAG: hypothetical protein WCP97_08075 [bacterium]